MNKRLDRTHNDNCSCRRATWLPKELSARSRRLRLAEIIMETTGALEVKG